MGKRNGEKLHLWLKAFENPTLETLLNGAHMGFDDFERFIAVLYGCRELTGKEDMEELIDELYEIYNSKA